MRLTFLFAVKFLNNLNTVKLGADIHVPLRMNWKMFGDPLTFLLAPSSGQNLICPILVSDSIPAKK